MVFIFTKYFINFNIYKYLRKKKIIFYICTDDKNFKSFKLTLRYLKEKKINFKLGNINSYIYDFGILSECDILINSSSTFCISAGFLGKKNKIIIHSKKWIQRNIDHLPWNNKGNSIFHVGNIQMKEYWKTYDNFWIKITEKNNFYQCNHLK